MTVVKLAETRVNKLKRLYPRIIYYTSLQNDFSKMLKQILVLFMFHMLYCHSFLRHFTAQVAQILQSAISQLEH